VPASKAQGIQPGKARGIGVAIVIKNFPPGTDGKRIPPAFETLTWCHDTQIDPQGSAS
jgi:hypothetical protein